MSEAVAGMPAESALGANKVPHRRRRNHRRARVRIDRRSVLGQRVTELERVFRQRLGDAALDPIVDTALKRAAELTALAEAASGRALRADPGVTLDDVVRLQRTAALAVHRLHLDRKPLPSAPSLGQLLAGRSP
jgi:hypothetical protein